MSALSEPFTNLKTIVKAALAFLYGGKVKVLPPLPLSHLPYLQRHVIPNSLDPFWRFYTSHLKYGTKSARHNLALALSRKHLQLLLVYKPEGSSDIDSLTILVK